MVSEHDMMTRMERAGRALGMKMVHGVGRGGGIEATFELTLALDGALLSGDDDAAALSLMRKLIDLNAYKMIKMPPVETVPRIGTHPIPVTTTRIDGRTLAGRAMRAKLAGVAT